MHSKTKVLSFMLLSLSSLALTACGNQARKNTSLANEHFKETVPKKPIKKGGTLTYALEADSPFTGIFLAEIADTHPDAVVSDPGDEELFTYDKNRQYNNLGAATLKLDQKAKTATIAVKKKVRWSDGQPVTAKDLEYAYEILANPKVNTTMYNSDLEDLKGVTEYHQGKANRISGIELPDGPNGKKAVLHFKEMHPAMLEAGNSYIWNHAAPYHYLKDVPFSKLVSSDKVRKKPLFFGPFKLDKLVRGQSTTWSRNPYYWRGQPNFDHVNISVISNKNASQAIKSHKFDVADVINSEYDQVKNTKGANFIGQKALGYSYLAFRVGHWDSKLGKNVENKHSKMNNLALRKAMLSAMNIDMINHRFYHDLNFRVDTLIPEQYGKFHDGSIPGYPYNLKKAKQLLDQAGYKYQKGAKFRSQPNGKPLTINLAVRASSPNAESIWSNYIQQWKKVGLNVRFLGGRPMEFNSWVQAVKAADPRIDVLEGTWDLGDASPNSLYGQSSQLNFARFASKTNNKLLNDIDSQKAFDPNYRIQAFKKWQRWMHDQAYFAPTSNSYELTAVNANVTGWSVKYNSNVWYDAGFVKK